MTGTTLSGGIISALATAATIEAGTLCVINAEQKLAPWTSGEATSNKAKQVFFTLIDAAENDLLVSAAVAGAYPGSLCAKAAAGTYATGNPVYAGTDGDIAVSGTRIVGIAAESVTLDGPGTLEIIPAYVPITV